MHAVFLPIGMAGGSGCSPRQATSHEDLVLVGTAPGGPIGVLAVLDARTIT